mmetsp:Transcript_135/g.126  ORF Transcript_135/g.126 Transcript_135/m.126 type:complete len:82 (-) Transcript_135:6572-6817(-)
MLDTETLDLIRCKFSKAASASQPSDANIASCEEDCDAADCICSTGVYVNSSMIYCPVPKFDSFGKTVVEVSVDGGSAYSTP